MGLNLLQLKNVKHQGVKMTARCPACDEKGNDRKGEHLFIEPGGRFGCVIYPGHNGHGHRQRIFELVGIKTSHDKGFSIRKPESPVPNERIIQKDILGRLGRIKTTHARKELTEQQKQDINEKEHPTGVPPVPKESLHLYSPDELERLNGIDLESLKQIDELKRMFNGTVVSVTD